MAHTNTKYLSMHIGWSKKVLGEKSLDVNQAVGSEFDIDLCLISLFAMIEVLDVSWKEPLDTSSQCYLWQRVKNIFEGTFVYACLFVLALGSEFDISWMSSIKILGYFHLYGWN